MSTLYLDVLYHLALCVPNGPGTHCLELGVENGVSLRRYAELFQTAHAVDHKAVKADHLPPNATFYHCNTDEFFATYASNLPVLDFVFIDAWHEHEQSLRDFNNVLPFVRPLTGLVVLHDTFPSNRNDLKPTICGDAWKTVAVIRDMPNVESVTLPLKWGLTVCRKVPDPLWPLPFDEPDDTNTDPPDRESVCVTVVLGDPK